MNPLTNVKNLNKINDIELEKGFVDKKSWHNMYKDSAWIFIGGLAYGMTEGDIICVFSQYGEVVNINMIRDKKTGQIKGFCFLCYANQKSTILAVDNFNGIKLCGRTIRVDHVANYKPPKEFENDHQLTKQLHEMGCAPQFLQPQTNQEKKVKKKTKSPSPEIKVKKEKSDPGYDKYDVKREPASSGDEQRKSDKRRHDSSSSEDSSSSSPEERSRKRHKKSGKKREDSTSPPRRSRKKHKKKRDDSSSEERKKSKKRSKKRTR